MPGPRPVPMLGGRHHFVQFLRDPIGFVDQHLARYGPVFALSHGDSRNIIAIGPAFNHQLLSNADLFHSIFDAVIPERIKRMPRGIGLLEMNGPHHKQQRRLMLPAFHRKQIEGYHTDMVALTEDTLQQWRPGTTLELGHALQQLSLRVAMKTLFGLDTAGRGESLGQLIKRVLHHNLFSASVMMLPFDLPGFPLRRLLRDNQALDQAVLRLIAQKRDSGAEPTDVLGMLIAARDDDGTAMTDSELLGQTSTLLIAGHETSANALTWTLLLLSQHPKVQADVVDELRATLGGAPPTLEQVMQLPLLERVIKESMRLLPPAAIGARITTAPVAMGPYELPKGGIINFSQYHTHRLPELYPDPLAFRPERWETLNPSPYEYFPFGAGPRMCIGASFAHMEIKVVLAMLLQRYRLQPAPGTEVNTQLKITFSAKGPLPMTIFAQDQAMTVVPVGGMIHRSVTFPTVAS